MEDKYVPNYGCSDCKHLCRKGTTVTCPCFDHSKIEHYAPWFKSCKEECHLPCSKFEPSSIHVYDLKNYWIDFESWWKDYLEEWFPYYPKEKPEDKFMWFFIGKDNNIAYGVKMMDYINCNMFDGNKFKAVKKRYYKQCRDGFGYKLVTEDIDGMIIE